MNWKVLTSAFIAGLLGTGLSLGVYHSYNDHKIFHALLNSIAQQQQRAQGAQNNETPK